MTTAVSTILKYLENNNQDYPMDQNIELPQRAKKRRLDHLTWEEKIQRKKLKNRVAAQTSRDRKKAKMEQMEQAIQQLFSKNESLLAECQNLKLSNQKLSQENTELYSRLRAPCLTCSQNRSVACEAPASGSAASPDLLQQRGGATHPAAVLNKRRLTIALLKIVLWKALANCLLCPICSTASMPTSMSSHSNDSRMLCSKTSPEIWKQRLENLTHKNQVNIDKIVLEKWWGRHQHSWNPVDVKC